MRAKIWTVRLQDFSRESTNFRSHALVTASVARRGAPYPVVIYSHGFRVNRRDNTAKCEELASHEDDGLLEDPAMVYPEVIDFSRK